MQDNPNIACTEASLLYELSCGKRIRKFILRDLVYFCIDNKRGIDALLVILGR